MKAKTSVQRGYVGEATSARARVSVVRLRLGLETTVKGTDQGSRQRPDEGLDKRSV